MCTPKAVCGHYDRAYTRHAMVVRYDHTTALLLLLIGQKHYINSFPYKALHSKYDIYEFSSSHNYHDLLNQQ